MLARPGGEFLLVEHATWNGRRRNRWGLPGGRLEWRERPELAACRELAEELNVHVNAADLIHLGDHRYKGGLHRIYGTHFAGELGRVDKKEIVRVRWFPLDEVRQLETGNRLHAGFEFAAVRAWSDHIQAERSARPD